MQQSALSSNLQLEKPVNTLEGRVTMQTDLDRLEEWANMNLMKLSKNKYKALGRTPFLGTARLEAALRKGPGHEPAVYSGSKDVQ